MSFYTALKTNMVLESVKPSYNHKVGFDIFFIVFYCYDILDGLPKNNS